MENFRYSQFAFQDLDSATRHFNLYDNDMQIVGGHGDKLQYYKKVCFLGKSFVSRSTSLSGWGYKTKTEVDGFLVTFPHVGDFTWTTYAGSFRASAGALAVADQREVSLSRYAAGISYTTVYIDNSDMFKYLMLVLGYPPKSRVYFDKPSATGWELRFFTNLLNTLFDYAEHSNAPLEPVAGSLKESLIGFLIYNIHNNYSNELHDMSRTAIPTPHEIKIAAEFMNSNYDPALTVGDIAQFAGISVRSLQTGFRRFKGMSPIEFLRSARINQSRAFLLKSGAVSSPQQAGFQVGFLNYYVFCKYYMQAFGEHPKTTHKKAKDQAHLSTQGSRVQGVSDRSAK